jgi:hypothetical protein
MKYKIVMDDKLLAEPNADLTQPEIRDVCIEYAARFVDVRFIRRSFYRGLAQVKEEVTEYRFTRVPKG